MAVIIGRSAKNYMERQLPELQPTYRHPGPIWTSTTNLARSLPPDKMPFPIPDLQHGLPGQDAPEGQLTERWPHGEQQI